MGKMKRLPKRLPRLLYPDAVEKRYVHYLISLVKRWREKARSLFGASLERVVSGAIESRAPLRLDDEHDDLSILIRQLKHAVAQINLGAADVTVRSTFSDVDKHNKKQVGSMIRTAIGVNVYKGESWYTGVRQGFIYQNVGLITKLSDDTMHRVEQSIYNSIRQGERYTTVAKNIEDQFDMSESRAELIARDQIGKLNGEMTQRRQESIGVDEYTWRTAKDDRVRGNPEGKYPDAKPSHYAREGKRYKWDKPPEGGHPGIAIQCRCWAEPVLDGVAEELGVTQEDLE
jgi:SPP1 gp7 family putative phage head morphogenesis protein